MTNINKNELLMFEINVIFVRIEKMHLTGKIQDKKYIIFIINNNNKNYIFCNMWRSSESRFYTYIFLGKKKS